MRGRYDREDVIPIVIVIVLAIAAAIAIGFWLDSSSRVRAAVETGGHIPFTNKDVTPGDPSSYVDTVGQCPFYEMAGAKGCVPPPDIECNADWSVCKQKEVSQPVSTIQTPPAASQTVESPPKVINCTESK